MRANLKSLSLLRCALQSVKNKDGRDYKNRVDKIHNLERALSDNPLFDKQNLLESLDPFLYNSKYNIAVSKGDVLLRNEIETVTGFDFKKQSFFTSALSNPDKKDKCRLSHLIPIAENNDLSYRERYYNPLKYQFEKPSKTQKELIVLFDNPDAFYSFHDKNLVKDFYKYHLSCFSSWHSDRTSDPPVFNVDDDGKLSIGSPHLSVGDDGLVKSLNPFLPEDMDVLLAASERGLNLDYGSYDDLYSITKKHFPALHEKLIPHLKALDIENVNQSIINDYRSNGFAQVSSSASRNKNIILKEKEKMDSNELNGQAGRPAEQDVNPENAGKLKSWEKTYSPEVMADPAAKAHAYRGANEFRTDDGKHRLYFNFSAKKALYGLSTSGSKELPPEKIAEYRRSYHSDKLPDFPEKAFHNGKPISPDKAFKILCSNPYYDMNRKKLIDLPQDTQTRADFLKQRSLDMGGKEYVNEDKGLHRIYFQSATAVKTFTGWKPKAKLN
jgi:hypothetical protein